MYKKFFCGNNEIDEIKKAVVMKKAFISFIAVAVIVAACVVAAGIFPQGKTEYLRIHIRANSNEEIDQSVKYAVKDKTVDYLTPYLADCDTRQKAEDVLRSLLPAICEVADGVLKENGFNYRAKARINNEKFPTRVYGDLTLDAGYYDALIIELGDGKGDNWWCVIYPPLCFTGGGRNYTYKSKIAEIIKSFFAEKESK